MSWNKSSYYKNMHGATIQKKPIVRKFAWRYCPRRHCGSG